MQSFLSWLSGNYGWDYWVGGLFVMAQVFATQRITGGTRRKALYVVAALLLILLWYALFVAAFIVMTAAWMYALSWILQSPMAAQRNRARFLHFGLMLASAPFLLLGSVSTVLGKRFYVWDLKDLRLHIGYKPVKLIAGPGDGDTGYRYFYTVGVTGVVARARCFSRASDWAFDRDEMMDVLKHAAIAKPDTYGNYEDEFRQNGKTECPANRGG